MFNSFKKQRLRRKSLCVWVLVCLFGAGSAWAESFNFKQDSYRFSGFATLGATKSGTDNLGFRRNVSQEGQFNGHWSLEPDTILGLQLDAVFTPKLTGAVQVVARDRASNNEKDMVDWAYFRYRFNPSFVGRAGRIGLDLFLLSEYRNLGFAYLWARPPVEFYGAISFDHFDGLDIAYNRPLGEGNLEFKLFGGRTTSTFAYRGRDIEYTLDPVYGFNIGWESSHWRVKLTFLDAEFGDKMRDEFGATLLIEALDQTSAAIAGTPIAWSQAEQLSDDLEVAGTGIHYYSLGIAYDNAPWVIQAETALITSDYDVYQSFYNSYLSVGYRIGPTTVYVMGAQAENRDSREIIPEPEINIPDTLSLLPQVQQDAIIASLQSQLSAIMPLHNAVQENYDAAKIDQKTFSLGMRWDIRYDLALKLQLDRTHVQAYRSALFDPKVPQSRDETIDTYSINLNYVF